MSDEQEYVARSVLVVVAHPDDAEFMAAGTIGKWACEGFEPHKALEVYVAGTNSPDVWIDITDTVSVKVEALRAHVSQIGKPRPNQPTWDLEKVIRERAGQVGQAQGLEAAESFKYFR